MSNKKLKIGITGNIGSGKSILSDYLSEKGYKVLIADKIAKDILRNNKAVKEKIVKEFGIESFKDGKLNTKYLAEKVFPDKSKVKKINSIVHPPTLEKIEKEMNKELQKTDLVFCESALIYEANMEDMFDYVLLVAADENIRIRRVMERDKVTKEEVDERIKNQIEEGAKRKQADFILDNNSTKNDFIAKAEFVLNLLSQMVN
jgi:dephospho-CoA kinase